MLISWKKVDFYSIVDHWALNHIIKGKAEPDTNTIRIVRGVKFIFICSVLYKRKRNDTKCFFIQTEEDESNSHEIIPISLNMQDMLYARYYNIHESEQKKCLIQTRSQSKTNGTISPKVHGVDQGVDPNIKPEKQIIKPLVMSQLHVPIESKDQYHVKPRLGQGRAGIKKKMLRFPMP